MPEVIQTAITSAATGPSEVESDGVKVVQQSLFNMVLADKYLASKNAMSNGRRGLRCSKIQPPSAV